MVTTPTPINLDRILSEALKDHERAVEYVRILEEEIRTSMKEIEALRGDRDRLARRIYNQRVRLRQIESFPCTLSGQTATHERWKAMARRFLETARERGDRVMELEAELRHVQGELRAIFAPGIDRTINVPDLLRRIDQLLEPED